MELSVIAFVFNELITRIDVRLLPFVGVFFILGYWLKRMKLPTWCPKVPMLMFIIGFAVFTVYSVIIDNPENSLDILGAIAYGFGNSAFFVAITVLMYDMKHQHTKSKKERVKIGGGNGNG